MRLLRIHGGQPVRRYVASAFLPGSVALVLRRLSRAYSSAPPPTPSTRVTGSGTSSTPCLSSSAQTSGSRRASLWPATPPASCATS